MGCPFLEAATPAEARQVLKRGITNWHAEPAWQEFVTELQQVANVGFTPFVKQPDAPYSDGTRIGPDPGGSKTE